MQETATEDQIQVVTEHLVQMGFSVHRTTGERQTILAAVGSRTDFDTRNLEVLSGVMEVHRISAPYKLAARSFRPVTVDGGTTSVIRTSASVSFTDAPVNGRRPVSNSYSTTPSENTSLATVTG